MLIRLIIENLFSFDKPTEFNMLPGRYGRLNDHVYSEAGADILKLNAIYGANGAGKSNLVTALSMLKDFLIDGSMPIEFITETFKFDTQASKRNVYVGVEFVKDNTPFYYGLTINQGIIVEEELLISGLGKSDDKVLLKRTDDVSKKNILIEFADEILKDEEASIFPKFLQNEMLERNQPVLYYMKHRQNKVFEIYKTALEWFERDLFLIHPQSRPTGMALRLQDDFQFREFAKNTMKSFGTGIADIQVETRPIEEFFGEDDKNEYARIIAELKANPLKKHFRRNMYEEVVFVLENDKPVAKKIIFTHGEDNGNTVFSCSEESDGTRRLMDYLPALYNVINNRKVYFIDEIERSIHPLLIKELIKKFSHDSNTKGQIIFSTHESNLLDQDIFRQDEIWFAEKDKTGSTQLHPLSEYKEHHTINIQKGYLNGRYGGIPFLGNLKDLNWDKYAEAN